MDGPVQIEFHLHQSWIGLVEQAVVERLSTRAVEKLEIVVVIGEAEPRIARLGREAVQPGDDCSETRLGALFLGQPRQHDRRSEEHTSELQSLMRNSYAVFCLTTNNN